MAVSSCRVKNALILRRNGPRNNLAPFLNEIHVQLSSPITQPLIVVDITGNINNIAAVFNAPYWSDVSSRAT